jgi:hypothetical protein
MAIDPTVLRRLAFARYLFELGLRQSTQPEPLGTVSLLMFHDSIEIVLNAAAVHKNVTVKGELDSYFSALNPVLPPEQPLPSRLAIQALNKARIGLKHHAIVPSRLEIEGHRATTRTFLQSVSASIFGLDFEALSMSDMIALPAAKELMEAASGLMRADSYGSAILKMQEAYEAMIDHYESQASKRTGDTSAFFFGDYVQVQSSSPYSSDYHDSQLFESVRKLADVVLDMQYGLRTIALGLDVRRHMQFEAIARNANRKLWSNPDARPPATAADARFCWDFVIDAALQLQQADADLRRAEGPPG